jgi:hypothetical protein
MRNFKLIASGVNVQPLVDALTAQPELWDAFNLRTTHPMSPHTQASDIVLRFNSLTDNPHDVIDDYQSVWYPATSRLPVLSLMYETMSCMMGDRLGRSVITRLEPGAWISPHIDQGSPVTHYQRFHICLQNAEGAVFSIENENFTPNAGDIYVVANHKMHSVSNDSNIDRLTMIVDIHTPMFQEMKVTS